MRFALTLFVLLFAWPATASEILPSQGGEVRVPLSDYTAMLNLLSQDPRRAPAAYAIGQSSVTVDVSERNGQKTAAVGISVQVEIFEDEWTLVPLLPSGAALRQATVDGKAVQLVEEDDGLSWSAGKAGIYSLQLVYDVDAQRYQSGEVLPLAVPRAAATAFSLSFPETGIDLSVVPSADLKTADVEGRTVVTASVPATSMILVTWRTPAERPFVISRAAYSGELHERTLLWTGRFQVELFGSQLVILPLMPIGVILSDIRVDGEPATVLEQDGFFATLVHGRGRHEVEVAFQVPVIGESGPPRASLQIPRIPVSRFDLVLPGSKDVKVAPGADVMTRDAAGMTQTTAFIPMSDLVVFTWTEAVPEDLRGALRANASLYHTIHAEEGVLHARGTVVYEITHGETNRLSLEVPDDAQVNRIWALEGGVSDWVVAESDQDGRKRIDVFLERPVTGEFMLEVSYEKLLGIGSGAAEAIAVPLLSADKVHRQRGMVALLSGAELALEPERAEGLTKVGENQLPPVIRNQITLTVAHTFKYVEALPKLEVKAVAPERKRGQFDAQIDTLVSLGDVTMKASATVEIDVKSGTLLDLSLQVPGGVNVLGVSGPSLRSHVLRAAEDGGQLIELEFTREMEGQFRIEVNYERIMDGAAAEATVPAISVTDAEVEHGRIAIEALTAVEVRATTVERLSGLDINELPQQLVLKTTNPILLAYRYVNAKPPFKLALTITRHKEIDVQVAAIERADYKSLVTRDGLAVTTAQLLVRNSQRQFLRLALPPDSQVWSVFVDGKPEKPAFAMDGTDAEGSAVLVKMINSARGFPVDIVYATPIQDIDGLGTVSSRLPRPDMVVTHSRWDVFLPVGPRYYGLESTMDLVRPGLLVDPRLAGGEVMARVSDAYQAQMGQPLRITVPTQGIQFAFEKLYANQSAEEAGFTLSYVSARGNQIGLAASAAGTFLLWLGIAGLASRRIRLPRPAIIACVVLGVAVLVGTIGFLGTSPVVASVLSLVLAAALAVWAAVQRWRTWRQTRLAA
ncbi:MAG TPA: hypothetical protein VGA50_12555 [Kiloniellales bacterium]